MFSPLHLLPLILIAYLLTFFLTSKNPTTHTIPRPLSTDMSTPSKRGLCWPVELTSSPIPFTRPGSKVSWLYNWSPNPTPSSSLPFIPMQWNGVDAANLTSKCFPPSSLSPSSPSNPPAAILGFNEPERTDQANMTAAEAAEIWLAHIEPLRARGVRAGSPGISSCEEGIAWLLEFVRLVRAKGGNVDFWALHWYGDGLGAFYDFIWSTHHRLDAGIPVWITEFACTTWSEEAPLGKEAVEGFLRESVKYLDTLDWVERYAWFGPSVDEKVGKWAGLLDENGSISELGKIYRDV